MKEYNIGDFINKWEIIDKTPTIKRKGQQKYLYTIRCSVCKETIRTVRKCEFNSLGEQCNKCMLFKRNTANTETLIGKTFGHLKVIGDAGYKPYCGEKKRHKSIVVCDCGKSEPFETFDLYLKNGNISSCGCAKHKSRGEYEIYKVLENIYPYSFSTEYSFPDLISNTTGRRLRFDFALFDKHKKLIGLIEFDGRQHEFGPDTATWSRTKDTLEDIQERDELKNKYCEQHNIPLCRINYKDFVKIPILLEDFINNLLEGGDAYE